MENALPEPAKPSFLGGLWEGVKGYAQGLLTGVSIGVVAGGIIGGIIGALTGFDPAAIGLGIARGASIAGATFGQMAALSGAVTKVVAYNQTGSVSADTAIKLAQVATAKGEERGMEKQREIDGQNEEWRTYIKARKSGEIVVKDGRVMLGGNQTTH